MKDEISTRAVIGGIAINPEAQTTTVYTASGNGSPYTAILTQLATGLQTQGQQVTVEELAPLSENDPQGAGIAVLGLPLAFGGMISAALLTLLLKGHSWRKLIGSLAISIIAGFVVTGIMYYGYNLFSAESSFWAISATISLGIAATSLLVTGLGALIGIPGVGLGAILTIFIANPLSGLATGWWWLPKPWGIIGQYLPIGATGDLLRSAAFFDGNGGTRSLTVLACWAIIGATFIISSSFLRKNIPEKEAAAA